jgi:hypothetical protein
MVFSLKVLSCVMIALRLYSDCFVIVSCPVVFCFALACGCLVLWLSCFVLRLSCLVLPSLILAFVILPCLVVVLNMVEVAFLRPRVGLCALMAEVLSLSLPLSLSLSLSLSFVFVFVFVLSVSVSVSLSYLLFFLFFPRVHMPLHPRLSYPVQTFRS